MVEDGSDHAGVGDEREDFHVGAALVAGQRVDVVDAVDELGPSFVGGASRRSRIVFVVGTNLLSVVLPDAIGVGAVEMNQVLVGLGDVCEDAGQKLERVGQRFVIELVSGLGLIDEQSGVWVESQPREVDRRPHEVAGELVQTLRVSGVDGGSIVDAKPGMSP